MVTDPFLPCVQVLTEVELRNGSSGEMGTAQQLGERGESLAPERVGKPGNEVQDVREFIQLKLVVVVGKSAHSLNEI